MARQGRAVVLVNAGMSVVIVAVIAGVSVFRAPAAPPTIQEFAPANPGRNITAEPSPQPVSKASQRSGPLARPKAPGLPSALQCWAWPDGDTTQTFDRESPPCQSSWDLAGGNGGATARGVTRTEIRVGVPAASVSAWQPLAAFFNHHYQLFGRTIRLVPLGIADLGTADGQRAAASSAAEHAVFATLDDPVQRASDPQDLGVYLDGLASAQVAGVLTRSTQVSTTALSAEAPFAWSAYPALDSVQRALGTAVCRELSGHHASYSRQTASSTRRFAALVPSARANGGESYDVGALTAALSSCHQSASVIEYDSGDLESRLASAKLKGITTVLPFGGARTVAGTVLPAAQRVDFAPEWLLPGLTQQRDEQAWATAPASQRRALFGLATWERTSNVARQALAEVAPSVRFDSTQQPVYDGLALIAAGAQLAGPRLTPQAFADGLESTAFANPGAGGPPAYQARVDFEDIDHTMRDDAGQVWWHDSGFCWIGHGKRWLTGDLPFSDPGFFNEGRGC